MITEPQLRERLAVLQSEKTQIEANLYATQGAIQECEHWLEEFLKPAPEAKVGSNTTQSGK
jgi:hypothetical protein